MSAKHRQVSHDRDEPPPVREGRAMDAVGLVLGAIGLAVAFTDSMAKPVRIAALVIAALSALLFARMARLRSRGRLDRLPTFLILAVLAGVVLVGVTGAAYHPTKDPASAAPPTSVHEPDGPPAAHHGGPTELSNMADKRKMHPTDSHGRQALGLGEPDRGW